MSYHDPRDPGSNANPAGGPPLGRWNLAGMSPEIQASLRARLQTLGIDTMASAPPSSVLQAAGLGSSAAAPRRGPAPPTLPYQAPPLPRQAAMGLPPQAANHQSAQYLPPQAYPDPYRNAQDANMNAGEYLDRRRRFEEEEEEAYVAPLDRPNPDRPAVTAADRRAQHAAAARAPSAAAAAAAAAAPAVGPDGTAVAFWPDLRRQLRTEADLRNLFVECAICTESTGDMMVLNCGHMLCRGCLDRVHATNAADNDPYYVQQRTECPFCKLPLGRKARCLRTCRDTQAQRFGIPVPKTMADLRDFPLTVPEGGSNARACSECREARVKQAMDLLVAALLNCDEADKKLVQVPPNSSRAIVEARMDADFERVPELQPLIDGITELTVDPDFVRKYAGVFPQRQAIQGFATIRKRGQTRDRYM